MPRVLRDLLERPAARGGVVTVVDADPARRDASARRLWCFLARRGVTDWVVHATADARRALPGSSIVLALPARRPRASGSLPAKPARSAASPATRSTGSGRPTCRRPSTAAFPPALRRACAELCPEAILLADPHLRIPPPAA